jgi:anti-anti-sigma factor
MSERVSDGAWQVTVTGEVDLATAPNLRDALLAIPPDVDRIVVDLSEVTFIDSTGIGALVAATQHLYDRDALIVRVEHPSVLRALELCGLGGYFETRRNGARVSS